MRIFSCIVIAIFLSQDVGLAVQYNLAPRSIFSEIVVSHPEKKDISRFVKRLTEEEHYSPVLAETIGNMLQAGDIGVEVGITKNKVVYVWINRAGGLKEEDKEFIEREIMDALIVLLEKRNFLPQIPPSGVYKIRITSQYDSLGNIKFLPHRTQGEFDLSPLCFLRRGLLEYAIRHEMDHALDTQSRDEEESEEWARVHDRWFFSELSFGEQVYLLWTFLRKNIIGENENDISDLIRIFAERNNIHYYKESDIESLIDELGPRQIGMDVSLHKANVAGVFIDDIAELPSVVTRLTPDELLTLQKAGEKYPVDVFRETFNRYKDYVSELRYFLLYISGIDGDEYIGLTADVLVHLIRKEIENWGRESDLEFFFRSPFRDRVIGLLIEGFKDDSDEAKRQLCRFFIRCFNKGRKIEDKAASHFRDLSPIWRQRFNLVSLEMPDYVKEYIRGNGLFEQRAVIGDFSWIGDWIDFDSPDLDINHPYGYFYKKTGNKQYEAGDLGYGFKVLLKSQDRYRYIPPRFIDSIAMLYWQGEISNEQLIIVIDLIGNDLRGRGIRFLRQVIQRKRIRSATKAWNDRDITVEERKKALEIYARRLGRDSVPHLLEWLKDRELSKGLESNIIEMILGNLTYEEIVDSLRNYLLDPAELKNEEDKGYKGYKGEKEYTVYKRTITGTEQAIRHLDILWDRVILDRLKGKKRSRDKEAFRDVREALSDIKGFMPIAGKMKFHILDTNEFILYMLGNHLCISSGALRIIRRRSSLRFALSHEISHRETTLANTLQRIKSMNEFSEEKDKYDFREKVKRFIVDNILGKHTFTSKEEEDADKRAIEVVVRLGYSAGSALRLLEDTHFISELSSGASPRFFGGHPNDYSRLMNMKGEALLYEKVFPAEGADGYLGFVIEETDRIVTTSHAFGVIERRWHSAESSCREPAIADWLYYVEEYLKNAKKAKEEVEFHPVDELIRLNNHYNNYRPLWLNSDEMLLDLIPLNLIDAVIEKDTRYKGLKGVIDVYKQLGMISPPGNDYKVSRTARVLYHLSHRYEFTLEDWLEIVRPVSEKVLEWSVYSSEDLFLRYSQAMLSAFIFGTELARKSENFGKSFEMDLEIIRRLAGLPSDEESFSLFRQKMHKVEGKDTVKDAFFHYYESALKGIIERHNVSMADPLKEKEVDLAVQFSLDPVSIIQYLYNVSIKGEKDIIKKKELFFATIRKITRLRYPKGGPNDGKNLTSGSFYHTVIEEEARRLFVEISSQGLMTDEIQSEFNTTFTYGENKWDKRHPPFGLEKYCEEVRGELVRRLDGIREKGEIVDIFLSLMGEKFPKTGAWGGSDVYEHEYDTYYKHFFTSLVKWIIGERLNYDVELSIQLAAKIEKVDRDLLERICEDLIKRIETNKEDTFSFNWFFNIYGKILDIAHKFDFLDDFINSINGSRYEDALSRLTQFPQIDEEPDILAGNKERERAMRFYSYQALQVAAYKKKVREYEERFGGINFEREFSYLVKSMTKDRMRDELLFSLVNRYVNRLDTERLQDIAGYFSRKGLEYKSAVIRIGISKIFQENKGDNPVKTAIDYVLEAFRYRSKYRDELIDYIMSFTTISKEDLLRYEALKTRFGTETIGEVEGDLFIKNLELISQLEPDKKLEFLLWIKGLGQRPSYFSIEGRIDIAASKRMGPELRKEFLNLSDNKLDTPDRFNEEFNYLHKEDRKRFFIEILGRPDGILSDSMVKKRFIEEEIWRLLGSINKESPEGRLIILYLEEADPLNSARVLAEILDISFEGLSNFQRLALILQTIGFIGDKTAQWFSVRLRSHEAREAFRDVQRRPRPFSKLEATQILEEEWGSPIGKVLKNGLGKELGYGSSKGVWEAELLDGTRVAVSVQRPRFRLEMDYQFLVVNRVLERFKKTEYGDQYRGLIAETMDVNQAMLEGESDLRSEVNVRNRLDGVISGISLPKVIDGFTTQRVVVSELVSPSSRLNEIEDINIKKKVVRRVIDAMTQGIVKNGVFHGDPWPSNILVDREGSAYFIDFAVGGFIPSEYLEAFNKLIRDIVLKDVNGITLGLTGLTDSFDGEKDLSTGDIEEFLKQISSSNHLVDMWTNLLEFLYKNGRRFKPGLRVELAKLLRTLGILEGLEQGCNEEGYLFKRLLAELVITPNGGFKEAIINLREKIGDIPTEMSDYKPMRPGTLILYAEPLLENGLVIDLEDTLRMLIQNNILGKVIIYAEDSRNSAILEGLLEGIGIEVITVTKDRLDDRFHQNGNEAGELDALVRFSGTKGIAGEDILGIIKGFSEGQAEISRFAESLKIPIVVLEKVEEQAVYSFKQAVYTALEVRKTGSGWFITLPAIRIMSEDIQKAYEEYKSSLELFRSA